MNCSRYEKNTILSEIDELLVIAKDAADQGKFFKAMRYRRKADKLLKDNGWLVLKIGGAL